MKFRALLSALLLAAGLVCVTYAGETKPASPSEVLKKFVAAMREQDFTAMANLSYGQRRAESLRVVDAMKQLKAAADSGDEKSKNELALLNQMLNDVKVGMQKVKVDIKLEKIEGDLAEVDAAVSGTSDNKVVARQCYFKKVNGEWKVINAADYKAEKAKTEKAQPVKK